MKNIIDFDNFLNESQLQDDYRSFFAKLLNLYGVKSPVEFKHKQNLSKSFYKDVEKGWHNGYGLTEYGKKIMKVQDLEELNEAFLGIGKKELINKSNVDQYVDKENLSKEEEESLRKFAESIGRKNYVADSPEAGWTRISNWSKNANIIDIKNFLSSVIKSNFNGRTQVFVNKVSWKDIKDVSLRSGFGDSNVRTAGA